MPHATTSALGSKPMEYAVLHFEPFRSGDGRIPCTQAGFLHQVLHAENGKEPKDVNHHHERMPVMLG
jgi:hypothetical protein